jgi:hypothetical protein
MLWEMIDPASSRTEMMGNKNNAMMQTKVCSTSRDHREEAGMDVGVGKKEC